MLFLEFASKQKELPVINDNVLAQLMLVLEMMAKSAKQMDPLKTRYIPEIPEYPRIQKEITDLQAAMQISKRKPLI
ncbi:hypothetical protein [Oceanobacillus chungangensis]|uniref:Uncharacterized protein n=1 Tax=Oceanobacillus chungangensis TaxID=1229152 RepID=A0A3D8PYZ5_9BACI|nr:hypothetical protein [Oceanobacillus chungangensis]RDW21244.1 hypothetical protein CWR45_03090 [Oceanobacillus chungangensis]